jgi:hypothetical protein
MILHNYSRTNLVYESNEIVFKNKDMDHEKFIHFMYSSKVTNKKNRTLTHQLYMFLTFFFFE